MGVAPVGAIRFWCEVATIGKGAAGRSCWPWCVAVEGGEENK